MPKWKSNVKLTSKGAAEEPCRSGRHADQWPPCQSAPVITGERGRRWTGTPCRPRWRAAPPPWWLACGTTGNNSFRTIVRCDWQGAARGIFSVVISRRSGLHPARHPEDGGAIELLRREYCVDRRRTMGKGREILGVLCWYTWSILF